VGDAGVIRFRPRRVHITAPPSQMHPKKLVTGTKILLNVIYMSADTRAYMTNYTLPTHAPFVLQTRLDLHRKHDLLRTHSAFRDVVKAIADDLVQPSIELLHRDMLQFSVCDQPWNLLQEGGQHTPGVIIGVYGGVTEAVGCKDIDHCRRVGRSVLMLNG